MKNTSVLLLLFITSCFFSCRTERFKKPENLIDENTMSDIIYELSVFYAAKGLNTDKIQKERLKPQIFIYDRFGVDSMQYVNSNLYYASKPSVNIRIYKRVEDRLKLENEKLKGEVDKRRKRDSIAEVERRKKVITPNE